MAVDLMEFSEVSGVPIERLGWSAAGDIVEQTVVGKGLAARAVWSPIDPAVMETFTEAKEFEEEQRMAIDIGNILKGGISGLAGGGLLGGLAGAIGGAFDGQQMLGLGAGAARGRVIGGTVLARTHGFLLVKTSTGSLAMVKTARRRRSYRRSGRSMFNMNQLMPFLALKMLKE